MHKLNKETFFECWKCGTLVIKSLSEMINRVYCEECQVVAQEEKQKMLQEYILLKNRVKHERALRMLEKQEARMNQYKDAAEAVLEYSLENPNNFGSSHEMIAAMEMIRKKIKIKMQHQVGKHRVDFYIEQLKVVLEIDGYMHKHKKAEDSKRDIEVLRELGAGWEIVRIPTKHIEENSKKLVEAIIEVKKVKQKARKNNNGVLPDWFSDREKAYYQKVVKQAR